MASPPAQKPEGYDDLLAELLVAVRDARVRAAVVVNRELVGLYWRIGRAILTRQARAGWGAKVIDRLAGDLAKAFPEMRGFSPRNLKYMRAFAESWPDEAIVQQLLHKLPWFHLCTLLDKVKNAEQRLWYVKKAVDSGWSRNVLVLHIERGLFERRAKRRPTSRRPSPRRSRTSRARRSRTPTSSTSSASPKTPRNVSSSVGWSAPSATACSNSARGSPSSATRCASRSAATSSFSICSSTT